MHDPMVVAFEIRRPWPRWTRLGSRRTRYWPALITVWHIEPRGRDAGELCPHYRVEQPEDGQPKTVLLNGWRFHAHHWRIQVHPLQKLRRRLLTRCASCGGRDRKGNPVNLSYSWGHDPDQRWWRGEIGLYHHGCPRLAAGEGGER
jgi:hypothetical protein